MARLPARARLAALLLLGTGALGATAGPAPADPGEFTYRTLPAAGIVEQRLDGRAPVFEFKTGPSAYAAFRLPDATRPYLLEVQSLLGPGEATRARVFYPVAALLDDNFMVVRQTDLDAVAFALPVYEDAAAPAYRLTLPIDPGQGHERYLIVYTPAALPRLRAPEEADTPEAAAKAAREAYAGASATGLLRILVRTDPGPR